MDSSVPSPAAPAAVESSGPEASKVEGSPNAAGTPAPASAKSPKGNLQSAADAVDKKAPGTDDPNAAPPKDETAAQKKARLLKGKVYGSEVEWDVDSMTDEELSKRLQMSEAFHKRINEVSAREKRIQEALEYGKSDPESVLKDLFGVEDPVAWMEKRLTEKYGAEAKKAKMTPEQVELEQLKAEKAQWEKKQAAAKAQREAKAREEYQNKVLEETRTTFEAALKKAGVPVNQKSMYELARIAKMNRENGIRLTPDQLAQELRSEFSGGVKHLLKDAEGASLLEELGDDLVNRIIKARIEKTKVPVPQVVQPPVQKEQDDDEIPPGTPIHMRSFFRKPRG